MRYRYEHLGVTALSNVARHRSHHHLLLTDERIFVIRNQVKVFCTVDRPTSVLRLILVSADETSAAVRGRSVQIAPGEFHFAVTPVI